MLDPGVEKRREASRRADEQLPDTVRCRAEAREMDIMPSSASATKLVLLHSMVSGGSTNSKKLVRGDGIFSRRRFEYLDGRTWGLCGRLSGSALGGR